MKKSQRLLTVILALLACLTMAFAVGCSNNTVTVSFEVNGGNEIDAKIINAGDSYTLPTPEKDGFVFDGWYLSADYSGEKVSVLNSAMTQKNVTVYAKWGKPQAQITLDADGGTLDKNTVSAIIGSNIFDAVKNIAPVKADHEFAYWSLNNKELKRNDKVPQNGATLKAVYKVKYTVEVNVQSINENTGVTGDYEKEKEPYVGYALVGEKVDVSEVVIRKGFSLAKNTATVSELTISATPAQNAFKLYFDRNEITVRFVSNYPEASLREKIVTKKITYGTKLTVITDGFDCSGYLLTGWTDGDNVYAAYAFNDNLYDFDTGSIGGGNQENDSFVPQDDIDLDAIWAKGIPDLFGGNDYVYLFGGDSDTEVYIQRGQTFFKAEYVELEENGKIVRTFEFGKDIGKIFEGDLFYAYSNSTRKAYTASRYEVGDDGRGRVNENVKISFDEYNGVTYREYNDENENVYEAKGEYKIDNSGYYHATFDSEHDGFNGNELIFTIGTFGNTPAFLPRDEFEYGLGSINYAGLYNGSIQKATTTLTLTGFGVGVLSTASGNSVVRYTRVDDVLSLSDSSGQSAGTYKLIADPTGGKGRVFVSYNANLDTTLETTDKKTSLTLDGMYNAVYVTEGKTVTGYYSVVGSSVFGQSLVRIYSGSETIMLAIGATRTTSREWIDGVLTTVQVTEYFFTEKGANYGEYYYFTPDGNRQQWPLIVFDETPELNGKASVYGKVTKDGKNTYSETPVLVGSYVFDSSTGLYTITVETYNDFEGLDSDLFVYSELSSFTFALATISNNRVYYVYSFENKGDTEETSKLVVYTNSDTEKGGKITVVNGSVARVEYQGNLVTGTVSTSASNNVTTISGTTSSGATATYYVQLDAEAKTFRFVDAPFGALYMEHYGVVDQNEYIVFDGLGGATYHYAETTESGTTQKTFGGTYTVTDEQVTIGSASYNVYTFSTDNYMNNENSHKEFKFIRVVIGNYYYAVIYKESEQGEYTVADTGVTLTLDGYLYATYTNADGINYTGLYTVSNGIVVMILSNGYFYFTLPTETGPFAVKGTEYGTYLVVENQNTDGYYVELTGDANKAAKVFKWKTDENGDYVVENNSYVRDYVDENATYTINGSDVEVSYANGGKFSGRLGSISTSNGSLRVLYLYTDMDKTFVNTKDFSVMVLNKVGGVTRYGKQGLVKTGTYLMLSDDLFFYMSSDGTAEGVGVYSYDKVKCTAELLGVDGLATGESYTYYTENFESLTFTSYGLASSSVDGSYYYVYENGNIVLYKFDKTNSQKNEYGFVRIDSLGSFAATLELNGKEYIEYDGSVLESKRSEAESTKYPFRYVDGSDELYDIKSVSFTPTGELGFEVTGIATIKNRVTGKEQNVQCRVIRKVENDVVVSTTLVIGTYNFDVSLTYALSNKGKGESTLTVNSETMLKEGYSNSYYSTLFYYNFFSPTQAAEYTEKYKDKMGKMTVCEEYDENGEMTDSYASASFADGTRYVDTAGRNMSFDRSAYTYKNGTYYVDLTPDDGIVYRMRFAFGTNRYTGSYAYTMVSFARVQTYDCGNGVTIEIQRNICSDSYDAGALCSLEITDNGKVVETLGYYNPDENNTDIVTYISRSTGVTGKISTYYTFEFIDSLTSTAIEPIDFDGKRVKDKDGNAITVYAYDIASSTKVVCNVYDNAKGDRYVEITPDNEVMLYGFYATSTSNAIYYFPTDSSYDSETGVYTLDFMIDNEIKSLYFKIEDGEFVEVAAPVQE